MELVVRRMPSFSKYKFFPSVWELNVIECRYQITSGKLIFWQNANLLLVMALHQTSKRLIADVIFFLRFFFSLLYHNFVHIFDFLMLFAANQLNFREHNPVMIYWSLIKYIFLLSLSLSLSSSAFPCCTRDCSFNFMQISNCLDKEVCAVLFSIDLKWMHVNVCA